MGARAVETAVLELLVEKATEQQAEQQVEDASGDSSPLREMEVESLVQYEAVGRLWSIARARRAVGVARAGIADSQCQELEGAVGALVGQLLREDWEVGMDEACRAIKWGEHRRVSLRKWACRNCREWRMTPWCCAWRARNCRRVCMNPFARFKKWKSVGWREPSFPRKREAPRGFDPARDGV